MKAAVYLHQTKQGAIRRGHPWIFPKAIIRQTGPVSTGELVAVKDAKDELIGIGVYNEHSLYRVRMLSYAFEAMDATSLEHIVSHRLSQAIRLRESVHLPNPQTTAYRLFNSEGDGLSGLTIDRFENVCVVASSAFWVEAHKDIILQCLRCELPDDKVVWLPQAKPLSQDGWKHAEKEVQKGYIQVLEEGVRFEVDYCAGQKTGLFLDQRDNHHRIGALAKGKRVLDLYTYTGGFALHAAMGGAKAVTAVDSSGDAIVRARRNAELNHTDCITFVEADARDYLTKAGEYDLVILDPPKLVPSHHHLERAKNYYRFLHCEVFKYMRPGALLLTCNCSAALSPQAFHELVSAQAVQVSKLVRTLGIYGPSLCHPTLSAFPEGNYLTAVLLAVV